MPMTDSSSSGTADTTFRRAVLLGAVFLIANAGLVYELLAGAVSAYLVGSAVLQFSLVVGLFLAAMGVGSFLSQHVTDDELLDAFVAVETAIAVAGGFSTLILYIAFTYSSLYTLVLCLICFAIGALMGMEIPLVTRLLKSTLALKVNISTVLGLDYLGALTASIAFPLVLLPFLGQMATSFFFGVLNGLVALFCCWVFRDTLKRPRRAALSAGVACMLLLGGLGLSGRMVGWFEGTLYNDTILLRETSEHQRIVVTSWRDEIRLYLNGNLQFATSDEHRYHETLAHTALGFPGERNRVLVLGGGDGLAVEELLKYDDVERIDVVELDDEVTEMFTNHPVLRRLNDDALHSPRVHVHNRDAMKYLESLPPEERYDRVVIDFPDPNNTDTGKLYTAEFYRLLTQHLSGDGYLITQATSPYWAPTSFWCIERTIGSVHPPRSRDETLYTHPLHAYVPSLGDWGFVLASPRPIDTADWRLDVETDYLDRRQFRTHFTFPPDMSPESTEINHVDNQVLVRYYAEDWEHARY
jgi:spermidine synthase